MPVFSKIKRCPDDEIGKNSLNPCAIPKTNASQISIDVSPRLFASLIAMSVVRCIRCGVRPLSSGKYPFSLYSNYFFVYTKLLY